MTKFPCQADLSFYESKRTPRWATRIRRAPQVFSSIESCVNAHGGVRLTSGECAAHNLIALLAGPIRRKQSLEQYLNEIAAHPECAINPEKRAAFARKWAQRLAQP